MKDKSEKKERTTELKPRSVKVRYDIAKRIERYAKDQPFSTLVNNALDFYLSR